MRRVVIVAVFLVGAWLMAAVTTAAEKKDGNNRGQDNGKSASVRILDDCNPADPGWAPTGGCTLRGGAATFDEFNLLLFSPLSAGSPVGHPAWRMSPTYFRIHPDEDVAVKNDGGRTHTFTEVEHFGGGFVDGLNGTLQPAPECAAAALLPPGTRLDVKDLSVGDHTFQCCIHPWMRMLIKVEAEDNNEEHHHH